MSPKKKYPNPKIDCRCGVQISGTNKVRVRWREGSETGDTYKVLERYYRCPKCGWAINHEVAAKSVEGGL